MSFFCFVQLCVVDESIVWVSVLGNTITDLRLNSTNYLGLLLACSIDHDKDINNPS